MLVALPHVAKEELLAALLIFRALYFLTPFAIALMIMACWELLLLLRGGGSKTDDDPVDADPVEPDEPEWRAHSMQPQSQRVAPRNTLARRRKSE